MKSREKRAAILKGKLQMLRNGLFKAAKIGYMALSTTKEYQQKKDILEQMAAEFAVLAEHYSTDEEFFKQFVTILIDELKLEIEHDPHYKYQNHLAKLVHLINENCKVSSIKKFIDQSFYRTVVLPSNHVELLESVLKKYDSRNKTEHKGRFQVTSENEDTELDDIFDQMKARLASLKQTDPADAKYTVDEKTTKKEDSLRTTPIKFSVQREPDCLLEAKQTEANHPLVVDQPSANKSKNNRKSMRKKAARQRKRAALSTVVASAAENNPVPAEQPLTTNVASGMDEKKAEGMPTAAQPAEQLPSSTTPAQPTVSTLTVISADQSTQDAKDETGTVSNKQNLMPDETKEQLPEKELTRQDILYIHNWNPRGFSTRAPLRPISQVFVPLQMPSTPKPAVPPDSKNKMLRADAKEFMPALATVVQAQVAPEIATYGRQESVFQSMNFQTSNANFSQPDPLFFVPLMPAVQYPQSWAVNDASQSQHVMHTLQAVASQPNFYPPAPQFSSPLLQSPQQSAFFRPVSQHVRPHVRAQKLPVSTASFPPAIPPASAQQSVQGARHSVHPNQTTNRYGFQNRQQPIQPQGNTANTQLLQYHQGSYRRK